MTTPSRVLNLLLAVRSEPVRHQFVASLERLASPRCRVVTAAPDCLTTEGRLVNPDAVILDGDPDQPQARDRLETLRLDPGLREAALIAVTRDASPAQARRLRRQGFDDVVQSPPAEPELAEVLETVLDRASRSPGRRGRLLTVLHVSGGAGATTLAVNAAIALNDTLVRGGLKSRRRSSAAARTGDRPEVCLIDLDVEFGEVGIYLDLERPSPIAEVVTGPDRLDQDMMNAMVQHHASGIDVLTAPAEPLPAGDITPYLTNRMLDAALALYRVAVIDMPRTLTGMLEPVVTRSDLMLLVTLPTIPAVRRLRAMLDMFAVAGLHDLPLRIVINRRRRSLFRSEELPIAAIERGLGRPVDFTLPEDTEAVAEAGNHGEPVWLRQPRSRFVKNLKPLVLHACQALQHRAL